MAAGLASGQDVDSAWAEFGEELVNRAKAMGYTVK
jgi:hypothetical protein